MNAKESNPSKSLAEFFASGKMDNDFELHETHVNGICVLYPSRSAQEHEYMIREKSMVSLKGREVEECVQRAKDLAYESAVSRLQGVVIPFPGTYQTNREAPEVPASTVSATVSTPPEAPATIEDISMNSKATAPSPKAKTPEPPLSPPPAEGEEPEETNTAAVPPDSSPVSGNDAELPEAEKPATKGTVARFDLDLGLQPASNLLNDNPGRIDTSADEGDVDLDLATAMNLRITILGKLHECYNKTAGEILETNPKCIVDFAHRYTGPKKDEKEALLKLYPEAVRRVNQAAAA